MMAIKLVVDRLNLNVNYAYAPIVGVDEEAKKLFWEDLDEAMRDILNTEKIFIGGDFNGHIGRNRGGTSLLNFAKAFKLIIANSCFSKKENYLVIFCSTIAKTQIDYFLLRKRIKALQERKTRDLDQVKCIKAEEGKELVEETFIKQRWQLCLDYANITYFHKFLNEEEDKDIVLGELVHSERQRNLGYYRCFRVEEVTHAISRMTRGRAIELDEISVNF
ncbi:hypothetical protein R3W88_018943 [Solanum pinnatisectum]|uniref:Craniofacial development protein 2-like n=1 Tax=Solanum pinnatisectum TaxID=50273 RepID=A0AAV9KHV1_9SOLN|nr:hypothetical protein R3W88_018943 [Solanum pinnatisectum]